MQASKFSDAQKAFILKQGADGLPVAEVCRRACRVLEVDTSSYHDKPRRRDQAGLEARIREIARVRVRYGYRRVHVLLRREGWLTA